MPEERSSPSLLLSQFFPSSRWRGHWWYSAGRGRRLEPRWSVLLGAREQEGSPKGSSTSGTSSVEKLGRRTTGSPQTHETRYYIVLEPPQQSIRNAGDRPATTELQDEFAKRG